MNMKKMVETSVCFHGKSSKDIIHSIILEKKRSENVLNIKKKIINSPFVMWQQAITHICVLSMFLRG